MREAQPYPFTVLAGGGPDLLAACHFIELADAEEEAGVVAMMGASMAIHEQALALFAGKRVRIIPHADDAGRDAVERWAAQLKEEAGAKTDAFSLEDLRMADGIPVKDLNDCCLLHPEDAGQLEDLLIV